MQCLGLEVPQALSVLGFANLDQSALRPAPLDFARQLRRDSRVLITECGSLGDPGTGTNRWLANIPPASRERLLAREGGLQLALQQRCCWLGREQPEFHPNSKISQVTGFDNRDFLPPYFPITRGEDRLFGQVVKFIYPHSVALEYAWAAPHLPIPERAWAPEENRYSISGRSFPGTMIEALFRSSGSCLATNVQDRLAYLARLLEDLAAAPDDSLLSRLAEDRHAYRASQMRKLKEQIAESAGLPEDWRNYISDALRQVESSDLGDFAMDGLKGSVGDLEGAGLVRFWRDAWRSFGRSMLAWGDIREAARDIVEKKYP